ncbi:hypothetical protein [Kribbella sp. NPDC023855]|uniref:hypothetical protein n=1 Tax=Kribbella sp. NPDC023855 TaxID=3154698 RepID=UPI0033C82F89
MFRRIEDRNDSGCRKSSKWLALLGGVVISFGATSAAAIGQNNLAAPPSGVQLGPDNCVQQSFDNGVLARLCKTEFSVFGFSKRVYITASIFNATANFNGGLDARKIYVDSMSLDDSRFHFETCVITGWLGPGQSINCSAPSIDPMIAKTSASYVFQLKSGLPRVEYLNK